MFTLSDATMSVEHGNAFILTFSGAQGTVTKNTSLMFTCTIQQDGATGTIICNPTVLAITGSTFDAAFSDTYEVEDVETVDTATCVITVTTSGIITDLDDAIGGDTVFGRQQALCDNQVEIAKKINTVRNTVIISVVGQIASLVTQMAAILSAVDDVGDQVADVEAAVEHINVVVENMKTTIDYGD